MANCHICKEKLVNRFYKMKVQPDDKHTNLFRHFKHCKKSILHSYEEESLSEIDLKHYQESLK